MINKGDEKMAFNEDASRSRKAGLAQGIAAVACGYGAMVHGFFSFIMYAFDAHFFYEGLSGLGMDKLELYITLILGYILFILSVVFSMIAIRAFKRSSPKPIASLILGAYTLSCAPILLACLLPASFSIIELAIKLYCLKLYFL